MRIRTGLVLLACFLLVGLPAGMAWAQDGEGDPVRGGELYVENCAMCHGIEGKGRVGASLEAFPGINVDAALRQVIAEGVPGSAMPAWSSQEGGPFTDQQIEDVVTYIVEAFAGTQPIEPMPTYDAPPISPLPEVEGDPTAGAVVYEANCAVCHGARGEGRVGTTLAKPWSGNQTAAYVSQAVREGIEGTAMPGWAKADGGPLTEKHVADVTAFVLALTPLGTGPTPTPPPEGPIGFTVGLVLLGALAVLVIVGLVLYYRKA